MKIKFDAKKLSAQLKLIKTSLTVSKGVSGEDLIGIGARDNQLIVYAYSKGAWIRVVAPCVVETNGVVLVDRARFFRLLDTLKGEVNMRKLPNGRAEITLAGTTSKFTLATSTAEMTRPRMNVSSPVITFNGAPLREQLVLNILSGAELAGGGYKVRSDGAHLEVMATDKQRLVVTNQILSDLAPEFTLSIPPTAIGGVFEIIKEADTVQIQTSTNLTTFKAAAGGVDIEYGYTNMVATFPNVSPLIAMTDFPNIATFDVADLIEAINQATALADAELPFADFNFKTPELCDLESYNSDGSAELTLHCNSEVTQQLTSILRLQIPHLKSLLDKAKAYKASYVTCQWGEKMPVRWRFDFEDGETQEFPKIDLTFIAAPLNRAADKTTKETK